MNTITKIRVALQGKKTFIIAAVAVVLNFAVYMNWLSVDQLAQVNTVLGFLGIAAVRAGLSNK
jgi:hypothetical protein